MGIKKTDGWDKNLTPAKVNYRVLSGIVNVPDGYYGVGDIQALRNMGGGVTYRVRGSYPDLVANEIGIKIKNDTKSSYANLEKSGYYNLALPGLRTNEIRKILDPSFGGDKYTNEILGIAAPEGLSKLHNKAVEYIKNSELVTVACGSNDVALNCLIRALHVVNDYSAYDDLEATVLALAANGQFAEAVNQIALVARTLGHAAPASAAYLEGLAGGSTMFFNNWDAIIRSIHSINPHAKIVAVGFYNPFKTYALTGFGDENLLKIGHALDPLLGTLDTYVTALASTRNLYSYANIWDTDVIGLMPLLPNLVGDKYFKSLLFNVHPSNGGQKYIAKQIIKTLRDDPTSQSLANPLKDLKLGYYSITAKANGGSVTTNAYTGGAKPNDYVRVYTHPDSGKKLKTLTVKAADGTKIETISYNGNETTFKMPEQAVTITATFN